MLRDWGLQAMTCLCRPPPSGSWTTRSSRPAICPRVRRRSQREDTMVVSLILSVGGEQGHGGLDPARLTARRALTVSPAGLRYRPSALSLPLTTVATPSLGLERFGEYHHGNTSGNIQSLYSPHVRKQSRISYIHKKKE